MSGFAAVSAAVAGVWLPATVWMAVVVALWAVAVRPLRRDYPGIARMAEGFLAQVMLLGIGAMAFVRLFATMA